MALLHTVKERKTSSLSAQASFAPFSLKVACFILLKWEQYFIFRFLCLIKPASDRITTFEHFINQKMGYCTV